MPLLKVKQLVLLLKIRCLPHNLAPVMNIDAWGKGAQTVAAHMGIHATTRIVTINNLNFYMFKHRDQLLRSTERPMLKDMPVVSGEE